MSGASPKGADATEMDWDDEDEATHIFDKAEGPDAVGGAGAPSGMSGGKTDQGIRPAAGAPTPAPPPPQHMNKATLLGMTSPLQPPPPPPPPPMSGPPQARMTPPPPPPSSVGGAFARASSVPAASHGPSGYPPPPTIQPMHAPPHGHSLGQTMPLQPPGMQHGQMQTSTAPMPMPGQHRPMPSRPPPPQHAPVQASEYPQAYPAPNRMEATAMLRPQQSSKAGLWIALALLVLAIAGGAAAFVLMPRTGRIVVNVNDATRPGGGSVPLVQVFVDGKKHCDTVPCFVEQQPAGSHTVKVVAQGYDQVPDQTVSVESKKDVEVTFALGSGTSKKNGTGIKVSGTQPGVKLFVDDKEIGPLPQELYDMTPGDHTIVVKGTERYQLMEKKIIVAKDEILDMGPVLLKVVKGKATVSLGTPGAKVYLVSGSDRRELAPLPISVDIPTSQTWALEASKTGYQDYKQPISFDDGQAEKTFSVELTPKGVPAPTTTATVAQVPTTPPPPTTPTTAPTTPPTPPTTATTAAAAQGEAYLNINSMPPSSCFLDGVPLGMTPKIRQSVKPGSHRIKFMHPEAGTKEITVTAVAGQTVNAVLKL